MAYVILFDDESTPPKPIKSQPVSFTGVSVRDLKEKINNYRTFVSSGKNTAPDNAVLATTLTLKTIRKILRSNEGSVGIRIYLCKDSASDSGEDAKFLIVPVYPDTQGVMKSGKYTDQAVTDQSGTVYLSDCPKPACPPPSTETYTLL